MYTAYGLLTSKTDFTLNAARDRLQAKFPAASVTVEDGVLTLAGGDWDFQLQINESPDAGEQQQMAEQLGGVENNPEVANCARRVEAWSNTNDPFLEHFGSFQQVIEVLQSFDGLIAVDPKEPAFM